MGEIILILVVVALTFTGCSERTLIRNAENYIKEHIGDENSYETTDKVITDTTFLGEI